jgi:Ulp1 family protease
MVVCRNMKDIKYVCVPVNIVNAHWVLAMVDVKKGRTEVWDPAGSNMNEEIGENFCENSGK